MRNWKKFAAYILAAVMFFSMIPAVYASAEGTEDNPAAEMTEWASEKPDASGTTASGKFGSLNWSLSGSTLKISGTGEMGGPSSIFENTSNADDFPWYPYRNSITAVKVGNDVTNIHGDAFRNYENLEKVTLGTGITAIGACAFRGCLSLTSINLPAGITTIGDFAFQNCKLLKSLTLPKNLSTLGHHAFYGCKLLKSLAFPDNLAEIPDSVCRDCTKLETVSFGKATTSIGRYAFYDCSSLSTVVFSDNLDSFGEASFKGCSALSEIDLPEDVTSIGKSAFWGTGIKKAYLGKKLSNIGGLAFESCVFLKEIYIPNTLKTVGQGAFWESTSKAVTDVYYTGTGAEWESISFDHQNSFGNANIHYSFPSMPQMKLPENTGTGISLAWDAVPGAAYYEVYRKKGTQQELIATVNKTSYVDKKVDVGTKYTYKVKAGASVYKSANSASKTITRNPFTDVSTSASYFSSVAWAVNNGIAGGTSATTFSPEAACTRYQFAVMLYKLAGKPAVSGSLPFTDVAANASYYKAVLWAYSNKIISGKTATTFAPNDPVTRYQVVQMLYKYAGKPAVSISNPFKDVKKTDSYYKAVLWAVENGITKGTTATTFSPNTGCKRYQLVVFLNKFSNK